MPFKKRKPKTGSRVKGKRNNVTYELKALIDRMLPADELERLWREKLYSKDEWVAMRLVQGQISRTRMEAFRLFAIRTVGVSYPFG